MKKNVPLLWNSKTLPLMNTGYTDFLRMFILTIEIEVCALFKRLVESPHIGLGRCEGLP